MSCMFLRLMWNRETRALKFLMVLMVLCVVPGKVFAGSEPLETVKNGTEKVLQVLQDEDMDQEAQRARIREVVDEHFDFHEMGKRALGPHWRDQPEEKQEEYVQAFGDFLFGVYIDRVEEYSGETIAYESQEEMEGHAVVHALVAGDETEEIPLEYRLHAVHEEWRVYDVVIEGVSLVNNYRSQFSSFLAQNTFEDLIRRLEE